MVEGSFFHCLYVNMCKYEFPLCKCSNRMARVSLLHRVVVGGGALSYIHSRGEPIRLPEGFWRMCEKGSERFPRLQFSHVISLLRRFYSPVRLDLDIFDTRVTSCDVFTQGLVSFVSCTKTTLAS